MRRTTTRPGMWGHPRMGAPPVEARAGDLVVVSTAATTRAAARRPSAEGSTEAWSHPHKRQGTRAPTDRCARRRRRPSRHLGSCTRPNRNTYKDRDLRGTARATRVIGAANVGSNAA